MDWCFDSRRSLRYIRHQLAGWLAASEAALAEQIANDPQNIHSFIATKGIVEGNKSFDDRTYIRFVYCQ